MNAIRLVAAAALLVASQAHAVLTITPNTLTATPSGQANGREIYFKLPLAGDTKNCIITIAYGEKAGVGPNNDGDTHLNGQPSLDRVRTYGADGTYTFTAKAKSGCTGEAKVTFTIGTPGRTAPVPAAGGMGGAPAVVSANPGLTLAHTKITSMQVSANQLTVGTPLVVKVFGTGLENTCPTTVLIGKNGNAYFKKGAVQWATGSWPRVSSFSLEPGTYKVQISMTEGGPGTSQAEREACGANSIAGEGATVVVNDVPH
jgi:hypothetical protein